MSANQQTRAVIIVNSLPPSGNVLKRKYRNPHAYARLRDLWKRDIYYSCNQGSRSFLSQMCDLHKPMDVSITLHHTKSYDTDNAHASVKPILDSLRNLKWLFEDSPEFCKLTVEQERINDLRTTIIISEAL